MTQDIFFSKAKLLQQVLTDLKPHLDETREEQEKAHYEIERQVQLCADLSQDIARNWLVSIGAIVPTSSREIFLELGKKNQIPLDLSKELAKASGMRNLIVHEYGVIDYNIFFGGLSEGHSSFVSFLDLALKAV